MSIDRESTVAQIVLEHSECAKVFCDHRIDFCCRGERSLNTACAEKGLDVEVVRSALELAIAGRQERQEPDPRELSTADLVAFIVSRHHAYLNEALRFLEPLASKVARVHGDHNPKLVQVRDTFRDLAAALEPHLREEEAVVFPALTAPQRDQRLLASEFESMQQEHLLVGDMLARLRSQADDFVPPEWACGSYRTLMGELAALEMDTLRHVHLETHVLMPRFKPTTSEGARSVSP